MDDNFETFAKKLGDYFMRKFFLPWVREHGVIQSYRATVVSVDAAAGTMVVQKPYDSPITLPYTAGAGGLTAGDSCVVFVLGESSNAIVVSDGMLSTL